MRIAAMLTLGTIGAPLGIAVGQDAGPDTAVLLDQDVTFRLRGRVSGRLLEDVGLHDVATDEDVPGTTVFGKPLFDRGTATRAVINPNAVLDYYRMVRSLSREDAERRADRLVRRVERTGRVAFLEKVDGALRQFFGPSYGAGTRLDDEAVFATYPPALEPRAYLLPYRRSIAGDDDLWREHLAGDVTRYADLASNPEWDRFHHPIDPELGARLPDSAMRLRRHRRVLIRRNRRIATFFPTLPTGEDLSDSGLQAGTTYARSLPRRLRRSAASLLSIDFLTLRLRRPDDTFTTRAADAPPLFRGHEARGRFDALSRPRVINVTPPNGETHVDVTTDWEDPDNLWAIPLPDRRPFRVRIRFAAPLDPRSVKPGNFGFTAKMSNPGLGQTNVRFDIPFTVRLIQSRLGTVEVELTPQSPLLSEHEYEIRIRPQVASLAGEHLNADYVSTFSSP